MTPGEQADAQERPSHCKCPLPRLGVGSTGLRPKITPSVMAPPIATAAPAVTPQIQRRLRGACAAGAGCAEGGAVGAVALGCGSTSGGLVGPGGGAAAGCWPTER